MRVTFLSIGCLLLVGIWFFEKHAPRVGAQYCSPDDSSRDSNRLGDSIVVDDVINGVVSAHQQTEYANALEGALGETFHNTSRSDKMSTEKFRLFLSQNSYSENNCSRLGVKRAMASEENKKNGARWGDFAH